MFALPERFVLPDRRQALAAAQERLRHLGQTFFIADARVGLLLAVAVALVAPLSALAGVAGAILARATADRLHARHELIFAGLFEINGFFYGLSVAAFVPDVLRGILLLILGSIIVAALTIVCGRILRTWNLPVLVLPYLMAMWMVYAMRIYWPLPAGAPLVPTVLDLDPDWLDPLSHVAFGAVAGVGQVFYQYSLPVGLLIVAGVAFIRPRAAWAMVWGSAVASGLSLALGVSPTDVAFGYFGFNGALLAVAVTDYRQLAPLHRLISVATLALVTIGIGSIFYRIGLIASALPYVLLVWGVSLVAPTQTAAPVAASSSVWAPPTY
jgi:urea transporter